MTTIITNTYLIWKPISLVNLISTPFVSKGKTGHLTKVCNTYRNIYLQTFDRQTQFPQKHCIKSYVEFWHFKLKTHYTCWNDISEIDNASRFFFFFIFFLLFNNLEWYTAERVFLFCFSDEYRQRYILSRWRLMNILYENELAI